MHLHFQEAMDRVDEIIQVIFEIATLHSCTPSRIKILNITFITVSYKESFEYRKKVNNLFALIITKYIFF